MHRSITNTLSKRDIGTDRRPSEAERHSRVLQSMADNLEQSAVIARCSSGLAAAERAAQAREREALAIRWALSQIHSEPVAIAAE